MTTGLYVDGFAGAARKAYLAAVGELLVADLRRLARLRVDMGDVGDVDLRLALDDAARVAGAGTGVALHHMDALDQQAVLLAQYAEHFALLALVAAGDDHHLVALLDLEFRRHPEPSLP